MPPKVCSSAELSPGVGFGAMGREPVYEVDVEGEDRQAESAGQRSHSRRVRAGVVVGELAVAGQDFQCIEAAPGNGVALHDETEAGAVAIVCGQDAADVETGERGVAGSNPTAQLFAGGDEGIGGIVDTQRLAVQMPAWSLRRRRRSRCHEHD